MVHIEGAIVPLASAGSTRPVQVAPFLIDRCAVSSARFLEYLDESGSETWPSFWPERGSPEWESRGELFDRLPVCGISMVQAQEFAAWYGLRLPTRAEWELAARSPEWRKFPWGDDSEPLCRLTNLLCEGDWEPVAGNQWADFLRYTAPVDRCEPGSDGYYHLQHTLGNVLEFTSSPALDMFPGLSETGQFDYFYLKGAHWSFKMSGLFTEIARRGLGFAAFAGPEDAAFNYGFRCARSLPD